MPQRDVLLPLYHMRDHASEALVFVRGKSRADIGEERMLQLALVRLLEIVGEAANRATPQVRNLYPAIPWRDIVSFRNRIVHGYDSIDLDIVWQIVTVDLPPLVQELDRIIAAEANNQ